jgi:hypothetical protein
MKYKFETITAKQNEFLNEIESYGNKTAISVVNDIRNGKEIGFAAFGLMIPGPAEFKNAGITEIDEIRSIKTRLRAVLKTFTNQ